MSAHAENGQPIVESHKPGAVHFLARYGARASFADRASVPFIACLRTSSTFTRDPSEVTCDECRMAPEFARARRSARASRGARVRVVVEGVKLEPGVRRVR